MAVWAVRPVGFSTGSKLFVTIVAGLTVANCAQNSQSSRRLSDQERREIGAFSSKKYGTASPRVVAEGQVVPKGGGRDHVGKSYTVAGRRYVPREKPVGYTVTGAASWYGAAFHGRRTANGEVYDRHGISAAHPTMPLPSYARVTNLDNRRSLIVRVNDRGPFHAGRVIDLSQKSAELLGYRHIGTARVRVEYVGRASLAGSDDRVLMASLSTDEPARVPGVSTPRVMVANAPALTSPRQLSESDAVRSGLDEQRDTAIALAPAAPPPRAAAAVVAAAAPAVEAPSSMEQAARRVASAPLPPNRPFDLATIPGAATPLAFAGAAPAVRTASIAPVIQSSANPVVASLFFAEDSRIATRFSRGNPLTTELKPQTLLALRR